MTHALLWVLLIGGPFVGAIAGAIVGRKAERARWARASAAACRQAYDDGMAEARRRFWAIIPEMVFTADGTLEPDLEGWEPWTELHMKWEDAEHAVGAQHAAARTSLNLP